MNRNASALAIAVGATLGASGTATAATYNLTLTQFVTYSNNGSSAGNLTSSTATWSYDDATNQVSQTGGEFNARFTISPTTTLFRTTTTGLVIGNGAVAAASSYACVEGNFGAGVGASICGNYSFGANFTNESTVTWGPGTAANRTLGGDDAAIGAQQSIATQNALATSFAVPIANPDTASTTRNVPVDIDVLANDTNLGNTLVLTNATCGGPCTPPNLNGGYRWTFTVDGNTPVTVAIDTPPTNGSAVVNGSPGNPADVDITYTPNWPDSTPTGTDTFTYSVNGVTADVTVTINNAVPDAADGDLTAIDTVGVNPAGLQGTFTVPTGNLGDGGTVTITAQGNEGTATVAGNVITYTIDNASFFNGSDDFQYTITDTDTPTAETDSGLVTVTIADANPVLNDDDVTTEVDTPVDVDFDFTPGNGALDDHEFGIAFVLTAEDGDDGLCEINGTTVTYTPDPGFVGTDSCDFYLQDGDGDQDLATITFNVVEPPPSVTSTGLREDDGGSSADWLILSLLGGSALLRRRRKAA